MKVIFLTVTLTVGGSVMAATDFADISEYSTDSTYKRTQTVKHINHLWVARYMKDHGEPSPDNRRWVRVKSEQPLDWRDRRIYFSGDVVSFKGAYYYAKRFSWSAPESKYGRYSWVEFTHPAMGVNVPVVTAEDRYAGIDGIDANFNGVRDDYEAYVLTQIPTKDRQDVFLSAGVMMGDVLASRGDDAQTLEFDRALAMKNALVELYRCQRSLAKSDPEFDGGLIGRFMNSYDRVTTYREVTSVFYEVLGEDNRKVPEENPCESLLGWGSKS